MNIENAIACVDWLDDRSDCTHVGWTLLFTPHAVYRADGITYDQGRALENALCCANCVPHHPNWPLRRPVGGYPRR